MCRRHRVRAVRGDAGLAAASVWRGLQGAARPTVDIPCCGGWTSEMLLGNMVVKACTMLGCDCRCC